MIQIWKLAIAEIVDYLPDPHGLMFSHFSKFQQFMFRRIHDATREKNLAPINQCWDWAIRTSKWKVNWRSFFDDYWWYKIFNYRRIWTENFVGNNRTDPTETRTMGFYIISQTTTELTKERFKLAHYGRRTFTITTN